jgi:bifunctional non-homologous end joining protein LigD
MASSIAKSAALYCREGTSDKVYNVLLLADPDGTYRVVGESGRRGAVLKAQPKGYNLTLGAAERAFTTLVNNKMRSGYQIHTAKSDTVVLTAANERTDTGLRPQLLNPIDETEALRLVNDDAWALEQKFDGERVLARAHRDGTVVVANRSGRAIGILPAIIAALAEPRLAFVLDGEYVEDHYYVFDVLEIGDRDLRPLPFAKRAEARDRLLEQFDQTAPISRVLTAWTAATKAAVLGELHARGAEGAVFKHVGAPYTPERPASGGPQRKYKFWKSASCIVAVHNDRASVGLSVRDGGRDHFVGNVTVKANQLMPPIGAIVEVKYLYVQRAGGALVQPELLRVRNDLRAEDCTLEQLQLKDAAA